MNNFTKILITAVSLVAIAAFLFYFQKIFPPCQGTEITFAKNGEICIEDCNSAPVCYDCESSIVWVHEVNGALVIDTLPNNLPRDTASWVQYQYAGPLNNKSYKITQNGGELGLLSNGNTNLKSATAELGYIMWCNGGTKSSTGGLNQFTVLAGKGFQCPAVDIKPNNWKIKRDGMEFDTILTISSRVAYSSPSSNLQILEKLLWGDIDVNSARQGIGTKIVIVDNFRVNRPRCDAVNRLLACALPSSNGLPLTYVEGEPIKRSSEETLPQNHWILMCEMETSKVLAQEECQFLVIANCHTSKVHIFNTLDCPVRIQLGGKSGDIIRFMKPNDCTLIDCTHCSSQTSALVKKSEQAL